MKNWLKKIIKGDSNSRNTLLENFQSIYGHYQSLLQARQKAVEIIRKNGTGPKEPLALAVGAMISSLNMISSQCSLDLVKQFQEIQERLHHQTPGDLDFLKARSESWPNPVPFSIKPIHSLEDLFNYTHELAIEGMFDLLDRFDPSWSKAGRVQTGLPINLHAIDLGGGLSPEAEQKMIKKDEILSNPLQAMFRGMYYPGISWSGPIGVNLKGLMVIMAQSTSRPEEDFWDKTYVLLTREYMNYNSRLGYHYNSVAANVGDNPEDNHIRFMFKGGAADDIRRARRARFIGTVLEKLNFEIVVQKDFVNGRFVGHDRASTEQNLDLIGRLMGCVRQRDMVMNDEGIVSWHIEAFLRGNYTFDPDK